MRFVLPTTDGPEEFSAQGKLEAVFHGESVVLTLHHPLGEKMIVVEFDPDETREICKVLLEHLES